MFHVVFGVESGLSTVHYSLGQLSFHESFYFLLIFLGEGGVGVWAVKEANSSQVSDMFHKEFQLLLLRCCFCYLQICQQTSWI